MPQQPSDHAVDRFGVEGGERIGRVRFEAEHALAPLSPFGMVLCRGEGMGDDATVAQAVVDRLALEQFDAARNVRMMPRHRIGADADRGLGQWSPAPATSGQMTIAQIPLRWGFR